nr:MAG TPA: hypothetical protein [Caudoviricetes sp.]
MDRNKEQCPRPDAIAIYSLCSFFLNSIYKYYYHIILFIYLFIYNHQNLYYLSLYHHLIYQEIKI